MNQIMMEDSRNIVDIIRDICERKAASHIEPSVAMLVDISVAAYGIERHTLSGMINTAISNGTLKRYRTLNGEALYPADMSPMHTYPVSVTHKIKIR